MRNFQVEDNVIIDSYVPDHPELAGQRGTIRGISPAGLVCAVEVSVGSLYEGRQLGYRDCNGACEYGSGVFIHRSHLREAITSYGAFIRKLEAPKNIAPKKRTRKVKGAPVCQFTTQVSVTA